MAAGSRNTAVAAALASGPEGPSAQAMVADADEVPHSPGPLLAQPVGSLQAWSLLLGPLIALATLVVPLATVVGSRQDAGVPRAARSHGPEQAGRFARTGFGEPGGGDPRR